MKKYQLILFALLLLCGCSNPVENAIKKTDETFNQFILPQISFINSSIDFVIYSHPQNFWFSSKDRDETPLVVEKLKDLINMAEGFEYSDYDMMQAKINLVEAATESRDKLINSYNNSGTSDYFAYLFFGDFGLMANNKVDEIPQNLTQTIAEMDYLIRDKYIVELPEMIFEMEMSAIGDNKISIEQYKEIRSHTVQSVSDSLKNKIISKNEEWHMGLIDNVMKEFQNQYPINNSYEYIIENQNHSGVLYKYMAATNVNYCAYENMLPGDCNWGYIFIAHDKTVISRFECFDADSIEYKIGKLNDKKEIQICELNKSYTFPAPDMESENSLPVEELSKQVVMKKLKNDNIELLPSDCPQYVSILKTPYELENGNQEIQTFVVKIASLEEYYQFVNDVKGIRDILKN